MKLTDQQKQDYINSPYHCPYCGGDSIESDGIEPEDGNGYAKVHCHTCDRDWTDVWQVVNIWEDD